MLVKPSFKKRLLLTTLLSLSATQIFASNNSEQIPIGKLPEWVVPESYDLDFKIDPAQKGYTGKNYDSFKAGSSHRSHLDSW